MQKSNKRKLLKYLFFAVAIIGCILLILWTIVIPILLDDYNLKRQRNPAEDPPGWYTYYQIDPDTILEDIAIGNKDVFVELESEPDYEDTTSLSGTIQWNQDDYMTIAKTHHQYLTGEKVGEDWKIYGSGSFSISRCRDNMQGFDRARFIFYKTTSETFPVTFMDIEPLEKTIRSSYTSYVRSDYVFTNPDLCFDEAEVYDGKVTADDALQIAESSGGKEMRQQLSNDDCSITINHYGSEYWHVDYWWFADDIRYALKFKIDANDGSYSVSHDNGKCERENCPQNSGE